MAIQVELASELLNKTVKKLEETAKKVKDLHDKG